MIRLSAVEQFHDLMDSVLGALTTTDGLFLGSKRLLFLEGLDGLGGGGFFGGGGRDGFLGFGSSKAAQP